MPLWTEALLEERMELDGARDNRLDDAFGLLTLGFLHVFAREDVGVVPQILGWAHRLKAFNFSALGPSDPTRIADRNTVLPVHR